MMKTVALIVLCSLAFAAAAGAVTVPLEEPWSPETGVAALRGPIGPFAAMEDHAYFYSYGQPYTIKVDDWNSDPYAVYPSPGNMMLLDLGEGNKAGQVAGSVENTITIGQFLYSFTGNNVGSLHSGLPDRLAPSAYQFDHNNGFYVAGDNYRAWEADGFPLDARVVVCPVVSIVDINGRKEAVVTGFTALYVDRYDPDAAENMMDIMFVSAMSPDILALYSVPEPSSLLALLCGVGGVGGLAWRPRKR